MNGKVNQLNGEEVESSTLALPLSKLNQVSKQFAHEKSYSPNHRLLGFIQNTKAIPECDPDCPDMPAAVVLFPLPCAQCAEGSLKIQSESRPTLVLNLHPVHFCYPSFYRRPISPSLIGAKSRINLHFHRFQADRERASIAVTRERF